ncbi:MAG: glycosyltransferase [Thermoguttaceae bacterium]|nr:glycosyltransferase [Thermoguttaceae bacterium]
MPIMKTPKLSICCITYNHGDYIRKTLDSFLMQKTNFSFEVLIHDDASTDGTADIIREYAARSPEIIKPILQKENQFSKGIITVNKFFNFPRIRGQYVAICDGDDYWTDPMKLQKQVDFLEAHPDYTICFHPVNVHFENQPERKEIFPSEKRINRGKEFTLDELVAGNFIQTNSVVYRWVIPEKESLEAFPPGIIPGDYFMHLMHAKHGKIGFINERMGVYRRHDGGVWQGEPILKYGSKHYRFYECADKLLDYRFHDIFEKQKECLLFECFVKSLYYGQYDELVALGKIPSDKVLQTIKYSIISQKEWSWKHKAVNLLAKTLGLGFVYFKSKWFWFPDKNN